MPYSRRYKKKRTYRRKPYKKFSRSITKIRPRVSLGTGVPDSMTVRLSYADQFTLDPGVGGTPASHVFRANSCYDPDFTGGGHQPYGWDEYSAFYNHYIVIGAMITLQVFSAGDTSSDLNLVTIDLSADSTVSSNITDVMERPGNRWISVGSMGANTNKVISQKFSAKKFFNLKDINDARHHLGAAVSTNPTEQAYFICNAYPYASATNTNAVYCTARIQYIVTFSEKKNLVQS